MRTLGKRVCSNAPRVRIPPHPPFRRQANLKLLGGMKSAAQRHRPTKGRPRRGEGRKPKSTFVVRAVRQVASRDQSLPIRHFAAGELEATTGMRVPLRGTDRPQVGPAGVKGPKAEINIHRLSRGAGSDSHRGLSPDLALEASGRREQFADAGHGQIGQRSGLASERALQIDGFLEQFDKVALHRFVPIPSR